MAEENADIIKVNAAANNILSPPSYLSFLLLLLFLTTSILSCGYSNPYVQKSFPDTPSRTLYLTIWQNRTNELGLESVYFRLFNGWFKRSGNITIIFDEDQADMKLTGEITSIDLPGLFYDAFDEALEVKVKLTVRFTLLDNRKNTILWQEERYTVYEPFLLDPTGEQTEYNKQRALLDIGDEIGELIYLRTHEIANNMP